MRKRARNRSFRFVYDPFEFLSMPSILQAPKPVPHAFFRPSRPIPNLLVLLGLPDSNEEGGSESNSHERPVTDGEELGQWVEGNVASWTLGVMVWRAHLGAGGAEATAGDELESWACAEG